MHNYCQKICLQTAHWTDGLQLINLHTVGVSVHASHTHTAFIVQINQSRPECGRQTLVELLIRPVQRLPSVALLLNGNTHTHTHAALEKKYANDIVDCLLLLFLPLSYHYVPFLLLSPRHFHLMLPVCF